MHGVAEQIADKFVNIAVIGFNASFAPHCNGYVFFFRLMGVFLLYLVGDRFKVNVFGVFFGDAAEPVSVAVSGVTETQAFLRLPDDVPVPAPGASCRLADAPRP